MGNTIDGRPLVQEQAQIDLMESERRFREIIEKVNQVCVVLDRRGRVVFANDYLLDLTGWRREEVVGVDWFDRFVPEEDRQRVRKFFLTSIKSGQIESSYENPIITKAGDKRLIRWTNIILRGGGGHISGTASLGMDVTDVRRPDKALRESEEKYRSLVEDVFDSSSVGIFILDPEFSIVLINRALERYFGLKREDVIGKDKRELIRERIKDIFEDPDHFEKKVLATYENNTYIERFECHVLPGPGREERWLNHWSQPIRFGLYKGGRAEHYMDITALKKTEEMLRMSSSIINQSPALAFRVRNEEGWPIEFVSENVQNILGYSQDDFISGRVRYTDIVHRDDVEQFMKDVLMHSADNKNTEFNLKPYRVITKAGQIRWVENRAKIVRDNQGNITHYQGIVLNVTDRMQLEEQLQQAQKMEAIGRLAGGVAHDFNNMLNVILGYGEMILQQLHQGDPLRGDVEAILEAGQRSATLARQLLAFSRKQTLQPKVLDLNDVLKNLEKMLSRLIGEDIDLVTVLAEDLGRVKADPGQIEQVIMNLAVNARDAMPEGGNLTIETANVELDEQYVKRHAGVVPGDYVMVAVTDTGCGMDRETLSKIFEPFFTTKEKERGTGLGLSVVYGIVKQSGGNIWVYSEPNQGTTFKIYLPRTDGKQQLVEDKTEGKVRRGGGESILVVEDEPALRGLIERVLKDLNYQVSVAANGGEALLLVENRGLKPDLIITDVVMPSMDGAELVKRLRRNLPDLKVLYMSGYTGNAIVHRGLLDPGTPFIQKPFSIKDIAAKIEQVIRGQI